MLDWLKKIIEAFFFRPLIKSSDIIGCFCMSLIKSSNIIKVCLQVFKSFIAGNLSKFS